MVASTIGLKRVVIEPVTRVEGHGKVTILLDIVKVMGGSDLTGDAVAAA